MLAYFEHEMLNQSVYFMCSLVWAYCGLGKLKNSPRLKLVIRIQNILVEIIPRWSSTTAQGLCYSLFGTYI